MMIEKRKLEILGAIVILIALVVAVVLLVKSGKLPSIGKPAREVIEAPIPEGFDPSVLNQEPVLTPEPIARVFVERYGSFSSESDFQNIDDVLPLTTARFRDELVSIARTARAQAASDYYGVSTRVIGMNVAGGGENAVIEVTTQRTESIGSPSNEKTRYQNLVIDLLFENGAWLVDGFEWQE